MTHLTIDRAVVEQALEALEWCVAKDGAGITKNEAMQALRAALNAEQQEPVATRTAMDVTIEDDALQILHDMVAPAIEDDKECTPVRLLLGDGHSGYGLYVASADYPEEGAVLLAEVKPDHPTTQPASEPVAVPQGLVEALKEAAAFIHAVHTGEQPETRYPLVDELEGYAAMLTADQKEQPAQEQKGGE